MRNIKTLSLIFSIFIWSVVGLAENPLDLIVEKIFSAEEKSPESSTKEVSKEKAEEKPVDKAEDKDKDKSKEKDAETDKDVCPISESSVEKITVGTPTLTDQSDFVDKSRNIKDLGTDIVVKNFFTTPDTLFNFMKLVYGDIEQALNKYKKSNKLDENAIFLLFKGGNVLRMVFHGVLDMLPPDAKNLLKEVYAPDFKRSDADFSVYIDENKLGDLKYDTVLENITDLVFERLNSIREEFKADPQKYFNFFRFRKDYMRKELAKYFDQANELPALEDATNDEWYKAKFKQIRLLDKAAKLKPDCEYVGQVDYQFKAVKGEIIGTPRSTKPDWIVNTDNRTLEWPWGSDPNKTVKFTLVRSKIPFDYIYEREGKLRRKPIGGELIDVSIPHRQDSAIRNFLDNYDKNVVEYSLYLETPEDGITLKAYSLANLAEDLQTILFDQFDRPWNGGPKYAKRINRLFFLSMVEVLGTYGMGSKNSKAYYQEIKNDILNPLEDLYPLTEKSKETAEAVVKNVKRLKRDWPELTVANNFWTAFSELVADRLIKSPLKEDKEEFKNVLEAINKNIEVADKLNDMPLMKIKPEEVYKSNMSRLF